jgi:hypothetical protein
MVRFEREALMKRRLRKYVAVTGDTATKVKMTPAMAEKLLAASRGNLLLITPRR